MHIEALSDWTPQAQVIPASQIDWPAVVSGAEDIRLRQLPGPFNSMGRVKFLFPNDEGIYLHDTPERDLLAKPVAARKARWQRYSAPIGQPRRSEEHTSELQSLMRISYAVFCLKKKNKTKRNIRIKHKDN